MAKIAVAPLVGAWIEILLFVQDICQNEVAPLVGAWIEIINKEIILQNITVAPLVGAWIEMSFGQGVSGYNESLPSWERGLKSHL